MKKSALLFSLLFICSMCCYAQMGEIQSLHSGGRVSIRGLSVVDDQNAWVSGSGGWVGKTIDKGLSWEWMRVVEKDETDFRDIEAFSDQEAILLSAGSPLLILRTEDGGASWDTCYRDDRAEIFFDGMDFWDDQNGIAFGDPIDGLLQLVVTKDGGRTWSDISAQANLQMLAGEAGFAASGTGIRTKGDGWVWIGSGGLQSRLLVGRAYGATWETYPSPMTKGSSSAGIFSIAIGDRGQVIAVGGDYLKDTNAVDACYFTMDNGQSWHAPQQSTRGFRSGVEFINDRWLISTGTSGVDVSNDWGVHWHGISEEGYHVVRKAKKGSWVVLAGGNGRIAQWVIKP
jgi:photosystem II stability/assembly factor-like uncharacterized protein